MEKKTDLNSAFLTAIQTSFNRFIESKTSRSTAKLKPLHGRIAEDLATKLGEGYKIWSQGYGEGREKKMAGKYMDKMVDIVIQNKKPEKDVAGIAVKFVMQNYSQNSNNYFENMLGETANIRSAGFRYFQVFVILDELPYYDDKKKIKKWESFKLHNVEKYYKLSEDDPKQSLHTPNMTLIYVVHVSPSLPRRAKKKSLYYKFYARRKGEVTIDVSKENYNGFKSDGAVILNDYTLFLNEVFNAIK